MKKIVVTVVVEDDYTKKIKRKPESHPMSGFAMARKSW